MIKINMIVGIVIMISLIELDDVRIRLTLIMVNEIMIRDKGSNRN